MNLRILNYFLTVAQEQNITRAADILHITQPTLSRQLMQLEEDLGVVLFERSQHKLTLTSAGDLLVHRAKEILYLVEKTETDLRDQEVNLSGSVSLGAGELMSVKVLADIMQAFQEKYPAVTFDLFTSTSDIVRERMENGLIDAAMMLAPIDMVNYDFISLPQPEEYGILMRADSPLADKQRIAAADLEGKPLLLPSRLQARSQILNWLSGNLAKIQFSGTCNLLGNAFTLVDRCRYYAIVVKPTILDENKLRFIPLDPPVTSGVYLAWRRGSKFSLTAQKFITFAQCFLGMK